MSWYVPIGSYMKDGIHIWDKLIECLTIDLISLLLLHYDVISGSGVIARIIVVVNIATFTIVNLNTL